MPSEQLEEWEKQLRELLDRVDAALEHQFGDDYPLRANRPDKGTTSNPKYDGLFSVDGKFSLGIASRKGPGYVIDIRMSTLARVPEHDREAIMTTAADTLRSGLPEVFPGRDLELSRTGPVFHITGDLDLR